MLGLKLIYVSIRGHWCLQSNSSLANTWCYSSIVASPGHLHESYCVPRISLLLFYWKIISASLETTSPGAAIQYANLSIRFSGICIDGFVDVSSSIRKIASGCVTTGWSNAGIDTFDKCSDQACREGKHAFVIIDDQLGFLPRRCLFYRCQLGAVVTHGGCFDANFPPICIATWILREYVSWI